MILQRLVVCVIALWAWATCVRAELRLLAEVESGDAPVVEVLGKDQVIVSIEGQKRQLPPDPKYRLEGDILAHAAQVVWSPDYRFHKSAKPDPVTGKHHSVGAVSLRHSPGDKLNNVGSILFSWPQGVPKAALLVFAWVLEGRVTQVMVKAVPSTAKQESFLLVHGFPLSPAEEAGQPVLLLWMEGGFAPVTPRFADAAAQSVIPSMMLGDVAPLRAALEKGLNPNRRDRAKEPLLHLAAECGNVAAVEMLLARGARIDAANSLDATALSLAAAKNRLPVVQKLIGAGANVNAGHPLAQAIRDDRPEVVRLLLDAKADVNTADKMKRSPFSLAIDLGQADVAREMLPRADKHTLRGEQIERVLITQAAKGHAEMVEFLLEQGVPANTIDRDVTPLRAAAWAGHAGIARSLLKRGARIDEKDKLGRTALMCAVQAGHGDCAQVLLDAGADVRVSADGLSPLVFAAIWNQRPLVAALLARGGQWRASSPGAPQALDLALLVGARDAVEGLIQAGAEIDFAAPGGGSAIAAAIRLDQPELLRRAVASGWNVDAELAPGWPALRVARAFRAENCERALRDLSAAEAASATSQLLTPAQLDRPPRVTRVVMPEDPRDAALSFPATIVQIDAVIDSNGAVLFTSAHEAQNPLLAIATLQAVAQWQFEPPTKDGAPAALRVRLPVEFPSSADRAYDMSAVEVLPKVKKRVAPISPQTGIVPHGAYVEVLFVITKEGRVADLRVVGSTSPEFEKPALDALRNWEFEPALIDGKPVACRAKQQITFNLSN